jgi:hypothetical protein
MGYAAGLVNKPTQPAADIVNEMVGEAYEILKGASRFISPVARL